MERDPLDEEFIQLMLEVENGYSELSKHEKVRIEQWVTPMQSKKLCQVTTNALWKKNRNKYASQLLGQVKEGKLLDPFVKVPPEGPIPQFQSHSFTRTLPKKPKARPVEDSAVVESKFESKTNSESKIKNLQSSSFDKKSQPSNSFDKKSLPSNTFDKKSLSGHSFDKKSQSFDKKTSQGVSIDKPPKSTDQDDIVKLKMQLEIAHINEQHLREELAVTNM